MFQNISKFQIILLSVFGFFVLFGVLVFSGIIPIGQNSGVSGASGEVVVWGTLPSAAIEQVIGPMNVKNKSLRITYVQKNAATYDADLLEAFASATGPDLFMLPSDSIIKNKSKILPIPYASYPAETFRKNFVAQGDLYLAADGVLGLPLVLDPLVLYYNTSILDAAGIPSAPQYWDEVLALAPTLTKKTNQGALTQSTIAFGEYDNVTHAKDIIALLVMQAGNGIVGTDRDGNYVSTFRDQSSATVNPALDSLRFYTDFANPLQSAYSWNKSQPEATLAFTSGRSAFYIGYASELFAIREKNPNLAFNVAMVPQPRTMSTKLTFGRMVALAIPKSSKNPASAMAVAGLFTSTDMSRSIATALSLSPVRRDILATKPEQEYGTLFYNAALISRGWLDPDTRQTDGYFRTMINDYLSGRETQNGAITKLDSQIDLLLRGR